MAYDTLFLRNLNPVPNGNSCEIKIIPLRREYIAFDVAECDAEGNILDYDKITRIDCITVEHHSNNICIQRSSEGDKYFRIMPVIRDGYEEVRLQETGNDGNVVSIKMIQVVVTYRYTPKTVTRRAFGRQEITPAQLEVNVGSGVNVKSGELGYIINGIMYPLPELGANNRFTIKGDQQNIVLLPVNSADKRFDIRVAVTA